MNIFAWIVLISGIYLVTSIFFMLVEGTLNVIIFKVIPLFLGLSCLVTALKMFNIIAINI